MDPFLLRTQLERNNADLDQYCKDISEWSEEMKKKEVGTKGKKPKTVKKVPSDNVNKEETKPSEKVQKVGLVDYAAWEKFDAEKECEKLDNEKSIPVAEYDELSDEIDEDTIEESRAEKDKGNEFFKVKDYKNAAKCYTKAIELYAYDPVYFANKAMCYLKLEKYIKAESDCTKALLLDKQYVKAYQRRAIARENLNKLIEAKEDILRVFDYEPSNKESKSVLKRIEQKIKEATKKPDVKKPEVISSLPSTSQVNVDENYLRPKSKFALSRQQNKEIKTSYSPSNIIEPISDKIIERKRPDVTKTAEKVEEKALKIEENTNKVVDKAHKSTFDDFKWPQHDSELKQFKSIEKSAKIRSQKALKRVKVVESQNGGKINVAKVSPTVRAKAEKDLQDLLKKEGINNKNTEQTTNNVVQLDDKIFEGFIIKNDSQLNRPIPKTSVQFYFNWKDLDSNERFRYLLQIHPKDFVAIFKDSLESAVFSEVLATLSDAFVKNTENIVPYLYGISKVKRFSTLTMFKTNEDKNALLAMVEYIKKNTEMSAYADLFQKKYEI